MKKIIVSLILILNVSCQSNHHDVTMIGILQTASHPALDAARDGFKQELTTLLKGKVKFVEQNAEGNASQAQSIAKSFSSNRQIDGIYAIASLAAQTAAQTEKRKPIFIDAVTDPKTLGVLRPNVCGSTDRNDVKKQVQLIKQLFPTLKKVALLYNPSENNSLVSIKEMSMELEREKIAYEKLGVTGHSEIKSVVARAARIADVLWVPADNLLVSAMPLVSKTALQSGVAVVASDVPSVSQGALVAQGVDYRQLGIQTAKIAARILKGGEKPSTIPIAQHPNPVMHINESILKQLRLFVPDVIKQQAILVSGAM